MKVTQLLATGALAALVLLPITIAQAQKASSATLPVHKRAAAPPLGNAQASVLDVQRRMRAFEQFMELVVADARDVARALREEHVGAAPGITDVGNTPGRDTGRAVDRVGSRTGGQGSAAGSKYENPLGDTMSGIDGRLRGNKPRSTVVGATQPGPAGVASSGDGSTGQKGRSWVTTKSWSRDGMDGTTTTTRDPRSGNPLLIIIVARDSRTGELSQWAEVSVSDLGDTTSHEHRVEHRGPHGQVRTVVDRTVHRGISTTSSDDPVERPYDPDRDPPLDGTQVAEGGGATGFDGPLGMSCNPITGVCGPGLKLGAAQVNPGRMQPQVANGQRLRMDPRGVVINPDPNALPDVGKPDPIDRDGKGPGTRPPKPY